MVDSVTDSGGSRPVAERYRLGVSCALRSADLASLRLPCVSGAFSASSTSSILSANVWLRSWAEERMRSRLSVCGRSASTQRAMPHRGFLRMRQRGTRQTSMHDGKVVRRLQLLGVTLRLRSLGNLPGQLLDVLGQSARVRAASDERTHSRSWALRTSRLAMSGGQARRWRWLCSGRDHGEQQRVRRAREPRCDARSERRACRPVGAGTARYWW